MAKRNQYNRRNFQQLGPLTFNQPIKFKNFNNTLDGQVRVVVSATFETIATAIGDGNTHTQFDVNRASNMLFFTNLNLTNTQQFNIIINNSQIQANSLVLIGAGCANDNGVIVNIRSQSAGTMTVNCMSNHTTLASGNVQFHYVVFGAQ